MFDDSDFDLPAFGNGGKEEKKAVAADQKEGSTQYEEAKRLRAEYIKKNQLEGGASVSMQSKIEFQANCGPTPWQKMLMDEREELLPKGKTIASIDKWSRATVDTSKFRQQRKERKAEEQPGLGLVPTKETDWFAPASAAGHGKGGKIKSDNSSSSMEQ